MNFLPLTGIALLTTLSTMPFSSTAPAETALETTAVAPAAATAALNINQVLITCPDDFKDLCTNATADPSITGTATASGGCGGPITITYNDVDTPRCPADRFLRDIQRTWTATDPCGNTASCTQIIHIVRDVWALDIKPTSCPNPIQIGGGGGQVSVGILGSALHDVSQIDPNSVRIWREGCTSGPLAPNMVGFEDVGTPVSSANCGCTTQGADGFMDLRLRFDKQALINTLGLGSVKRMTYVRLVVTARLQGGCEIVASDCVRVQ